MLAWRNKKIIFQNNNNFKLPLFFGKYPMNFFSTTNSYENVVFLALGSNLGNRFSNFQKCVKMIYEKKIGIIEKTSQIYESPCLDENNLIVETEPKFLNSVIKIKTNLSPMQLLIKIKEIEEQFKRKPKTKYYEAREIDIDIILFNNDIIDINHTDKLIPYKLNIPHVHMYNRLFVLRPLLDIDNELKVFNRENGKIESVKIILKNLFKKLNQEQEEIIKNNNKNNPEFFSNFFNYQNFEVEKLNFYEKIGYLYKTFNVLVNDQEINFNLSKNSILMGVINCTPDSFSGGLLKNIKKNTYDEIIENLIFHKNNIDIIDIGGESTRPGSSEVDPREEFERIAPLIEKIRKNEELKNKIISIDTRKSYVAEQSINLGANIINDVSGGMFDPEIIKVAKKFSVPFILMHSRTTPDKMMKKEFLNYEKGVVEEINLELEERINHFKNINISNNEIDNNIPIPALDWNIILDPGLGFSKNREHNLEIIRNLDKIKQHFPNVLLLGHSKKKFIQQILNVNADNTLIGNVVITALGLEKGANIIRVHDFSEIKQTILISDAVFKN
jgi:dihydropteroate synthase/2-amino-4-hydroxy-6-hydroxymethyldihydropteridine diphosphokinase